MLKVLNPPSLTFRIIIRRRALRFRTITTKAPILLYHSNNEICLLKNCIRARARETFSGVWHALGGQQRGRYLLLASSEKWLCEPSCFAQDTGSSGAISQAKVFLIQNPSARPFSSASVIILLTRCRLIPLPQHPPVLRLP